MSDNPLFENWYFFADDETCGVVVRKSDTEAARYCLLVHPAWHTLENDDDARNLASYRAIVAAGAPALIRALLLVEWVEQANLAGVHDMCPACLGSRSHPDGPPHQGHEPGCPVDDALKAAGFFQDQASRDAAREMIRKETK